MGHISHSRSHLVPLIDRLNRYPVGLVNNALLKEILSLLFQPREAFVASRFPLHEATLAELMRLTKMPPQELLPILEAMAQKGLVMDTPYEGTTYYLLVPGVIGFFEFTFMKARADLPLDRLARLMTDYFRRDQGQRTEFFGSATPVTRSLAYEEHVPLTWAVAPHESVRQIILSATDGAAGSCYCRNKMAHHGQACLRGAPLHDICISLDNAASFLVRRGFAQRRSPQELLAIIDNAHALGLTHITENIRSQPSFICNCCGCCCEILSGVRERFPHGVGAASFRAHIDPLRCTACGLCLEACNVAALSLDGEGCRVDEDRCLGCGACVAPCPRGAIALVAKAPRSPVKRDKQQLYLAVLREKRRLVSFALGLVKDRLAGLLPW